MLNSITINSSDLDGVGVSANGKIIRFEQSVYPIASAGVIIYFEQSVGLLQAGSGLIVSVEQLVKAAGSGNLVKIAQNVQSGTNTYFSRNNYDIDIYINNALLTKSQICSEIIITKTEGAASDCKFSILPPSGVQNPENYQGQSVFVNLTNSSGVISRAFTGYIDTPILDIIENTVGKISFSCTDRRQTRILALPSNVVANIGQFSQDIFGNPKDTADELSNRLMTVAASFDFDNYGNYQITPWEPKITADFVLGNSDIYLDKPQVSYTNRTKTLNTVDITVSYKYQRLHQQIVSASWSGYQNFLSDWFNVGTPSFPQRTSIASAASSASWTISGNINYVSLWPAGGYGAVQWQPNTVVNTYVARTVPISISTATGTIFAGQAAILQAFVLDANGKKIYDIGSTTITDTSSPLCRGATWTAAKKFAQSVTELYSLKFTSPQAISRFGIIDSKESYTITDPYNTSIWINDKSAYNAQSTPGTALNATTDAAGYAKGTNQITMPAGGTGSFNIGNQITIDNDPSGMYYTITETISDISSGGTLSFSPGLHGIIPAEISDINLIPLSTNGTANFYINQKPLYPRLISALSVACQKAQTALLSAHRDVTVAFRRKIWPEIDLVHTVQTTATKIASKGKVYTLSHRINCETGEAYTDVSLKLSRSYGGDTQSVYNITIPPYEDPSYIGIPTAIELGTHYGMDPSPSVNPGAVNWNGYIGNNAPNSSSAANVRTKFPESFIVDYPAIPLLLTQERTVTQNPPGTNNGVHTNSAGYLKGVSSIVLAAAGTGQLLQGDTITIVGDNSAQIYVCQNDILDVSVGGILSISPSLGANLSAATHNITSSPPGNQFIVAIPNDSLTVTF